MEYDDGGCDYDYDDDDDDDDDDDTDDQEADSATSLMSGPIQFALN